MRKASDSVPDSWQAVFMPCTGFLPQSLSFPAHDSRSQAWKLDEASMYAHITQCNDTYSQLCKWTKCSFSHFCACLFVFFACTLYEIALCHEKNNSSPRSDVYSAHRAGWISSVSLWFPTLSSLKQTPSSVPHFSHNSILTRILPAQTHRICLAMHNYLWFFFFL